MNCCLFWFILVIACFQIHLEAFKSAIFYQKLREPTPQWMIEQIEHDLASFKKELSFEFIDAFFAKDGLFLTRVRVVKGGLTIQKGPLAHHGFYRVILNGKDVDISDLLIAHLQELHRLAPLPDVDFVFTSCDHLPPHHEGACLPPGNPIWPIFVMSKCKHDEGLILMPDWYSFDGYEPQKSLVVRSNTLHPWPSKLKVVFFRGADSGAWGRSTWSNAPRPKLVALSAQHPQLIDAKFPYLLPYKGDDPKLKLQNAREKGWMGDYVPMQNHPKYRYLIDIDGHCASTPRLPLLLHANSVLFKNMTSSMLWFYGAIKPYVHFVPVKEDLSDLLAQLEWARNHDRECLQISNSARAMAKEVLTQEMAYLYLYRLLEAYSKKQLECL